MENSSSIKNMNTIGSVNVFSMQEDSGICSYNKFLGSYKDIFPYKEFSNFTLGSKSLVTYHHHFNVTDSITIGENVVFGGIHTQVWSHGFDVHRTMIQSPITIGNDIYIGSGVIICQGVSIADNSIIGAGTVISKSINESGFYVSNQLIRKSELQSYLNVEDTITKDGYKFYRKINTNEK
jgi:acetyltransferase-like isoleucine patch superfamily enzyme